MAQKKSTSNISYNSKEKLFDVLTKLVQQGLASYCFAIHHEPEGNEKKPHWHIHLSPNRSLDLASVKKLFDEYDPSHPDKPLSVTSVWSPSDVNSWLLYGVHDKSYGRVLAGDKKPERAQKGREILGKKSYPDSDVFVFGDVDIEQMFDVARATLLDESEAELVCRELESGTSAFEVLRAGYNPMLVSTAQRLLHSEKGDPVKLKQQLEQEHSELVHWKKMLNNLRDRLQKEYGIVTNLNSALDSWIIEEVPFTGDMEVLK